ncbi:MAG: aminotransferase, partial [Clostridiales bacterium]
ALKPAAADFRIFWDNAYCVHHLDMQDRDHLMNIYDALKANGKEDMVYMYSSTAKITFAGGGISAMAASPANIDYTLKQLTVQTISYDKMNQLRHCKFFGDINGLYKHMEKHAAILKPKFQVVLATLDQELSELDCAEWKNPKGGYFVSVNTMEGCAKRVVQLCKEAGVVLTGAGATYPYGNDPYNSNIRIAPSYPPVNELQQAMALFCICVKLASVEKLLA